MLSAEEARRASALVRWAELHGAEFSRRLRVDRGPYGFGAWLLADLAEGDALCTVPLELTMSKLTMHRSPYAAYLNTIEDEWIRLYVFIASEKFDRERDSFWRPYLDMLPEQIDTPVYWPAEVRALLRGSNLYDELEKIEAKLAAAAAQAADGPLRNVCGPRELRWAYAMFWSRALALPVAGDADPVPALVPLADLLNHSPHIRSRYEVRGSCMLLVGASPQLAGHEAFQNYGARSNEKLLLNYGFTDSDNALEAHFLRLQLPVDIHLSQRRALLQRAGLSLDQYIGQRGDLVPAQCLAAAQLALLRPDQLYAANAGCLPANVAVVQALAALHDLLVARAARYPPLPAPTAPLAGPEHLARVYVASQQALLAAGLAHLCEQLTCATAPTVQPSLHTSLPGLPLARPALLSTAVELTAAGLRAGAEGLAGGAVWLSCPRGLAVTDEDAAASELGQRLIGAGATTAVVTCVHLAALLATGPAEWQACGQALQAELEAREAPVGAGAAAGRAAASLWGDGALGQILDAYLTEERALLDVCAALGRVGALPPAVARPQLRLAYYLYNARAVPVRGDAARPPLRFFLPLAHWPRPHPLSLPAQRLNLQGGVLELFTHVAFGPHEAVYWGPAEPRDRVEQVVLYGCMPPHMPDDSVSLEITLPPGPLRATKAKLLHTAGLAPPDAPTAATEHFILRGAPTLPDTLLRTLRVALVRDNGELSALANADPAALGRQAVSPVHEARVLRTLSSLLAAMREELAPGGSGRVSVATRELTAAWVASEQQIIAHTEQLIQACLAQLSPQAIAVAEAEPRLVAEDEGEEEGSEAEDSASGHEEDVEQEAQETSRATRLAKYRKH